VLIRFIKGSYFAELFGKLSPTINPFTYGVATISRIDEIIVSFAKEPYKRDDILQKRPTV